MVKWLQRNPWLYGHVLGESLQQKTADKDEKYMSPSAKETLNSCLILLPNEVEMSANLAEEFGLHQQVFCALIQHL